MENIDERAKKFFSLAYIGKNNDGADENGHRYFWQSDHGDLVPTKIYQIGNVNHCAYCNRIAYPIQAGLRHGRDYKTTGYTCICKKAMDEVELKKEIAIMEERHFDEMEELKNKYDLKEDFEGRKKEFIKYINNSNIQEFVKSFTFENYSGIILD